MEQNQNKSAVFKGLAFPIGYSAFMNMFQSGLAVLVAGICLVRMLLALIAAPQMGADTMMGQFMLDYTNMLQKNTWFLSAITTALAIIILWIVFNRKGKNFAEYFRFTPAPAKAFISAVLLGLGLFCVTNVILSLLEQALFALLDWLMLSLEQSGFDTAPFTDYVNELLESLSLMYDGVGMFIVAAVIGAPVIEELVFRAGPLKHLTKKMPVFAAVMLTSALFALAHGNPIQMIYTFALGVACAYLFIKTDSIYPAILCHFTFNGANLFASLMQTLFSTDQWADSPYYTEICANLDTWSTITYWAYLIAMALIAIPALIVGILLLIRLRRSSPDQAAAPTDIAQILYTDDAQLVMAAPSLASQAEEEVEVEAGTESQASEIPVAPAAEQQNSEENA